MGKNVFGVNRMVSDVVFKFKKEIIIQKYRHNMGTGEPRQWATRRTDVRPGLYNTRGLVHTK